MTIFYDLTKQTPEQIVAGLIQQCQTAAETGQISNVVPFK